MLHIYFTIIINSTIIIIKCFISKVNQYLLKVFIIVIIKAIIMEPSFIKYFIMEHP